MSFRERNSVFRQSALWLDHEQRKIGLDVTDLYGERVEFEAGTFRCGGENDRRMELRNRKRSLGPGRLNDRKRRVLAECGHERRPLVIGHDNDRTLLQGHLSINAVAWRDPSLAVLMPCQQTAEASGVDLTFATLLSADLLGECQILNSTRNICLLVVF